MFVTVEGIEGCGKSTLVLRLAERLRDEGRDVFVTREPGGTPAGDAIRGIFLETGLALAPITEAMLINAARAQHVLEAIEPALKSSRTVLCDRYVDSTLAYQGYGRNVDLALLRGLCDMATGGLTPDLTFILDIPVAVSRERVAGRMTALDRMESETDAFHERVRRGFLDLATPGGRYRILDATKSPVELAARSYELVRERQAR